MKITPVNTTNGTNRLLLIFTGWSTDARLFADICPEGWDVVVCSDYSSLSFPTEITETYSTVYLLAWSLGVAAAAASLSDIKLTAAFAVNGTEAPVSDTLGIPEAIYTGTRDRLDQRNLQKFRRRMFASGADFDKAAPLLPDNPDIESLKTQLTIISKSRRSADIPWKRVFISDSDRIIPSGNQLNAWSHHPAQPEVIHIQDPHFPDFKRIITTIIPDTTSISASFSKALDSYNTHAHAQLIMAERLTAMIADEQPDKGGSLLEIGPGSGLFTHLYSKILQPSEALFIDLYPTPRYDIAPEEKYFCGDAEILLTQHLPYSPYNAIVSAAAIQWFADQDGFFTRAAEALKPGGILACSTFLPGNLGELDALRPAPLVYHSEIALRAFVAAAFPHSRFETQEIPLFFSSAREALTHLRLTGVSASSSSVSASRLLRGLTLPDGTARLTYRAIYIVARK